jgi:anaerobic magnesium-protoporphyrin IX monomethyl ester cyclase
MRSSSGSWEIMSKVLITHSYFYRCDPKQWRFKQPYAPLGTIQAAAVIRESGFPVSFFDTNLLEGPETFQKKLQECSPRYVIIWDDGFNYLTKMCLTNMREAAFRMASMAKNQGCTVIVSSSDATDHYEKYFPHGVDIVVRGEGEETLRELLPALEKKSDLRKIPGLAFKCSAETVLTAPRQVMRDLDALPLPAWDLVDIPAYKTIWRKNHGYFSLNIATTRGCPFKCNWCAKPIYGNRYNSRSPKHVVREIEMLIKLYQPEHFWICDDIFGLKPGWVEEFRTLVSEKNLRFHYKIQSRADLLLNEHTINALAESGAKTVWIGAESGSQKILDAMDKGISVDQIRIASRLLQEKKIETGFFLQFGYPGETLNDIHATIQLVLELMPADLGISVSYPLPGTKFYDKVKGQLSDKRNWSDSDDLAMMFESTFNKEYYRQLHRYVHSIYRKKKGYTVFKKILKNPFSTNYRELRSCFSTLYYVPATFSRYVRLKKLETALK